MCQYRYGAVYEPGASPDNVSWWEVKDGVCTFAGLKNPDQTINGARWGMWIIQSKVETVC